ncbi:MAG: hypothetical protein H7A51_11085 [Akkermansiaceae bacterium]|nr:hypothetical protein [Akkermansiaceae bacterium]
MNSTNDSELAKALEGHGEILAELDFFCIKRHGYLLLALPRDASAAGATLGLYHPQATRARVLVWLVGMMLRFRCHVLLPKIKLTVRSESPMASMLEQSDSIGYLLGNPESASRRVIIVYRKKDQLLVDKLGLHGGARASVIRELGIIKELPPGNRAIPVVVSHDVSEQWASYATRYLYGKSPRKVDDAKVLDVLNHWLKNSQREALHQTRQWQEMVGYAAAHNVGGLWSQLETVANKQVQVGLFHGDFAPWNIKVSSEGTVAVMDWESGCAHGPAGWDWLHYMIQSATLVDHHNPAKVLDICREWAKSNAGRDFLATAGWGSDVECWLGSYLAYSAWIGGFDREELLVEWMKV